MKRLTAINNLSQKDSKWIHRHIFRSLNKDEIWLAAYEKLTNKKVTLTPGSIPKTMYEMSFEKLKRLKDEVLSERYKFNSVKLTYIPRPDDKMRPLGFPPVNDKIVQEVIRMVLEAIYAPIFSKLSFGFRTRVGCHDALAHVERKFSWVDYCIESNIEQSYPIIDHHVLIKTVEKRINDPRFSRLIWKFLRSGILDKERIIWSKRGIPHDSIVSPMLTNIYYHELDEFVEGLIEQYMIPKSNKTNLKSTAYKSLEYRISKIHNEMKGHERHSRERQQLAKKLKTVRKEHLETPGLKEKITRIEYVRYADAWMIGIAGDKKLADQIKDKVDGFMKNTLKQKFNPIKTKITNLRIGNAHFLGYDIFLTKNRPILRYKGKGVKTIRKGQPQLRFDVPVRKITNRYVERGYLKYVKNRIRPISKAPYTVFEDHVIVSHYRTLWLRLLNYYSGCTNRGRLQYIHYLLHMSCAMTLGHRHRMSCSQIFKKHGRHLTTKIPHTDKEVWFPYKTSWRFSERRWLLGKENIPLLDRYPNFVTDHH